MRILLANDDGIDAPGLALLARAAAPLGEVFVVAPERKWTAASHQLSFGTDLRLSPRGERRWACSGSPADCVAAAMTVLFPTPDTRPDLVLGGVNDGRNAGEDVIYSGTLAVAREATFWHVPAIGFSRTKGGADDDQASAAVAALIGRCWAARQDWTADGGFLCLNLPRDLPAPTVSAAIGADKIGRLADVRARDGGTIVYRLEKGRLGTRAPGDINAAVDDGAVAVTRLTWRAALPFRLP